MLKIFKLNISTNEILYTYTFIIYNLETVFFLNLSILNVVKIDYFTNLHLYECQ